jgi:hypothetical protein
MFRNHWYLRPLRSIVPILIRESHLPAPIVAIATRSVATVGSIPTVNFTATFPW